MERNAGPRGDTCRSARAGPGVGGPLRLWQQSGDSLWVEGAQSRKQVGARLVALETTALNSAEP